MLAINESDLPLIIGVLIIALVLAFDLYLFLFKCKLNDDSSINTILSYLLLKELLYQRTHSFLAVVFLGKFTLYGSLCINLSVICKSSKNLLIHVVEIEKFKNLASNFCFIILDFTSILYVIIRDRKKLANFQKNTRLIEV